MDFSVIADFISSQGFPIAMCIGLLWFLRDQMNKMTEAVNNNTVVLTKLCERIGVNEHEA